MCLSNEFCKKTRFSFQTEKTKNCHAQPKKKKSKKLTEEAARPSFAK